METMYLEDLKNSTEVVLDARHKLHLSSPMSRAQGRGSRGRARRAAAGAVRLSSTIGAALTSRRVLEPVEARLTTLGGFLLLALVILFVFYPKVLMYPLLTLLAWIALGLLYRGYILYKQKRKQSG
jgi:cardiolipin synthase